MDFIQFQKNRTIVGWYKDIPNKGIMWYAHMGNWLYNWPQLLFTVVRLIYIIASTEESMIILLQQEAIRAKQNG